MMKNILIVGGSYGIGYALAKELSIADTVFIASRTFENPDNVNAIHIPFDAAVDILDLSVLPPALDGFVFCPGSINLKPFKSLKAEAFLLDFEINFLSMIRVLHRVLPNLLAADSASIALFSSIAASTGMPFHTSIAAAKGAVEGFAKSLAAEYAPKIRVNVVAPSLTQTPLSDKFLNSDIKQHKSAERHPMKRIAQPQDIAAAAAFLLSDKSSWISGQVFHVDGGLSTLQVN